MKPLAAQMPHGLGLDAPQKISSSTAATAGSCADGPDGKPAFLFGTYQQFGNVVNSNSNLNGNLGPKELLIGEVILGQQNYNEQNENMQNDEEMAHDPYLYNKQRGLRHSDQLPQHQNSMTGVDQRALQELPLASLKDMNNRHSLNNVAARAANDQEGKAKKLSTSSNRLQSGNKARVQRHSYVSGAQGYGQA